MQNSSVDERRLSPRVAAWFPVEIGSPRKQRLAVSRNASATGLLLASHSRFEIGEEVTLRFKLSHRDQEYELARGCVVRYEVDEEADLWPHVMAVKLAEPVPELMDRISQQPTS